MHYHCAALLEQAVSAKDYRPALAVYTIVVLTSGDKHGRDMSMIDFDPKDRHGQGLGEIPHKIVYLCPKYLNDEPPEAWREWLFAINDSLDEEVDETHYHKACVRKILTTIQKNTLTPDDLARMKDEYSDEPHLAERLFITEADYLASETLATEKHEYFNGFVCPKYHLVQIFRFNEHQRWELFNFTG